MWTKEEQEKYIKERIALHKLDDYKCSAEEMWQSEDVFKVMKGNAVRSTKNCNTEQEALEYISRMPNPKEYTVEKKQSEFRRCDEYCEVSKFCSIKLARGNK
jgi:hypothetical protein